jgi:galactosyl transferase GMA12/MNN10 family
MMKSNMKGKRSVPSNSIKGTVLIVFISALIITSIVGTWKSTSPSQYRTSTNEDLTPTSSSKRLKIALITVHVPSRKDQGAHITTEWLPYMLNKACYAKVWGYDFILNTTWAYPDATPSQYWLKWGHWHRVPHMMAALPHYDWVLYADSDWIVQDMMYPLESLIYDSELNGQDVHVVLPWTAPDKYTFSSYAVLVRNSPFGRRLIENWYAFSQGMCPKGNFQTEPEYYSWKVSDQPGLWYALARTHYEMHRPNETEFVALCTEDGYLNTTESLGPQLNKYFQALDTKLGVHGEQLRANQVPPEQPILWSLRQDETKSGLGLEMAMGGYKLEDHPHAFAMHWKGEFTDRMKQEADMCKKNHGCYAFLDNVTRKLEVGCK